MNLTPQQALDNLARVAEAALLNGPDRRAINESIAVLHALVSNKPVPVAPTAEGGKKA